MVAAGARGDRLDDTTGVIRDSGPSCPYDLLFTARERRRDPAAGVLEIAMTGDLEGWARWTVTADGTGSLRPLRAGRRRCASRCCDGSPYRDGRCSARTTR